MFLKILSYGIASAMALLVDVGLLLALTNYYSMHYLWAAAIGFSSGCVVAFLFSIKHVFDNQSQASLSVIFSLFVVTGVVGLLLNQLILWISVDYFELMLIIGKAISAATVFWVNFYLRGRFVFHDPSFKP